MSTPQRYNDLAEYYRQLAEAASDSFIQSQLQALANSYGVLAESAVVLNRAAKALEAMDRSVPDQQESRRVRLIEHVCRAD
jgi:hypothetical protein